MTHLSGGSLEGSPGGQRRGYRATTPLSHRHCKQGGAPALPEITTTHQIMPKRAAPSTERKTKIN